MLNLFNYLSIKRTVLVIIGIVEKYYLNSLMLIN